MSISRALIFSSLMLCTALPAWAGEVGFRAHDRGDSLRLVLEWPGELPAPPQIRVVDERTVEVTFSATADLPSFKPDPALPEIVDIRRVSEPGAPLKIWVMLADKLYQRDVSVGSRVMIDVGQSASLRAATARATAAAKSVAAAVPSPEKQAPAASTPDQTPVENAAVAVPQVTVTSEHLPQVTVSEKQKDDPSVTINPVDPPVLTFASTSAFGVAAFVAHQTLWVVIDDPDFIGTPKLSGTGADAFPPIDRTTTKDATVFRLPLPSGVNIWRGEGGDLLWRVVFAAPKPDQTPLSVLRQVKNGVGQVEIPVKDATKLIRVSDPETGEVYQAVTVKRSNEFLGSPRRFAEFNMLASPIGIAVAPLADDVKIDTKDDAVILMRERGLSVTSEEIARVYKARTALSLSQPPNVAETAKAIEETAQKDLSRAIEDLSAATGTGGTPLFRFDRWAMGGLSALLDNEAALVAELSEKDMNARASGLMNIGKMYLANDRGAEAAGYFRLALEAQPGIGETPEFLALRGAAYALNNQFDLAYEDLRSPTLDIYPDVNLWRAYTLANLQDWNQAQLRLGKDLSWARQYPDDIARPMLLSFAEISLRAGKPKDAAQMLAQIDPMAGMGSVPVHTEKKEKEGTAATPHDEGEKKDAQKPVKKTKTPKIPTALVPILAQYNYLQGETSRQTADKETARRLWSDLAKGIDDKYRARARLALTVLDYEEGKIKLDTAIDQLESLRFAWRGDEVEAAINARLGDAYIEKGDYLRGLNALKEAMSMAPDTDMGRRISATMTDTFRSLFIGDRVKKIDPIDAITVYEKFSELVPAGADANRLSLALVDRLMAVDLLDRASAVLSDLVDHRLEGDARVMGALRLAATHLLNKQPQAALGILNRAGEMMAGIVDPSIVAARKHELAVLRARAQYQSGQVNSALATLAGEPETADTLRAQADIAWQTARWVDAASALEKLVALTPIPENAPPTDDQAQMIRNLAVATNLAGDRGTLARLRNTYHQRMMQTGLANEFDVITRARQTPTLADRDTLTRLVGEVDLFGNFLDTYRKSEVASSAASSVPPPPVSEEKKDTPPTPVAGTVEAD